jgi:hypothetical protein
VEPVVPVTTHNTAGIPCSITILRSLKISCMSLKYQAKL